MSRIGNKVITVPAGVEVNIVDNFATVKGPKGELKQQFDKDMTFNVEGNEITVVRPSDNFVPYLTSTAILLKEISPANISSTKKFVH